MNKTEINNKKLNLKMVSSSEEEIEKCIKIKRNITKNQNKTMKLLFFLLQKTLFFLLIFNFLFV